jgi:hypothetical protein
MPRKQNSSSSEPAAVSSTAAGVVSASSSWGAERDRSRANQAKKSKEGRDIAPLPAVVNPERKAKAAQDYEFFCRTYFPNTFNLPWSTDHRELIEDIQVIVVDGGQKAFAMPRGTGKTSLCEAAVLWATLYGYCLFPLVIGSDAGSALEILESIQKELETNDLLLEDFPEVCYPIRRLEGIAHRCKGQLLDGERTHIHWASDCIVLPSVPGSKASGSLIAVAGLTGRLRGMKFKRPDGTSVRPDLVLLDDPQTDESARSPSQCATRKRLVNGAVLGLAGPGKEIAALMPCTVIAPGDLSDELLDREKNPQWRGKRTAMVKSWPTNQALWDQYAEIWANSLRAGNDGQEATDFYAANREQMDAGFVVSWPARKKTREISGQQHAMNLRLKLGDVAFFAEYQNAPLIETQGEEMLTAGEISKKLNGLRRGAVPVGRDHVTAFIDVQGNLLYWMVVAWAQDFTGDIVDYGSWPDQKTDYFSKRGARRTLKKTFPKKDQNGQIYAGLEQLTEQLLGRKWIREGDGAEMRITRCPIDANWGESTDTVYLFCRQTKWAGVVIPSHGKYVGASSKPWEQYVRREGELLGNHWMLPSVKEKRAVRHLLVDTNFQKTFVHQRLSVAMGDRGCLALPGRRRDGKAIGADEHRMLSEHLVAEYRVKTQGNGRTVDEWKPLPGRPDNDFLDCLVGNAVAASMLGCSALASTTKPRPKGQAAKPRRKVSYLE